ncbi:hypothetical protein [Brevibacillus brevis]|uniref:hypothetical protein n=3 Tax=Brevibacillus TaxID=55080 RepID=UPI0011591170|nr:hypothetical protein [Lysinibacillus sp. SDF0063]TQR32007.1 hypothetical protein C7Y45_22205 [Lysinibacillus sp. SDF0063]
MYLFFVGLTLCMIAWIAGGVFLYQGDYVTGGVLLILGLLVFISMILYYSTNRKKRKNGSPDCSYLPVDCPDCDTPDCDCKPDCGS